MIAVLCDVLYNHIQTWKLKSPFVTFVHFLLIEYLPIVLEMSFCVLSIIGAVQW